MGQVAVFFALLLIACAATKARGADPVRLPGDYYMVFRIQSGIGKSAYNKFMDVGNNDDGENIAGGQVLRGCRTTDGRLPCKRHFRSKLLDVWNFLPIERVRVGVYKDNVEKRFWELKAACTDFQNWFSKASLLYSSYTDLSTTTKLNYFSISGDKPAGRPFLINNNYGGCPVDKGWLVVLDKPETICNWEKGPGGRPKIMYSRLGHKANWNHASEFDVADVLVVSVKFKEFGKCPAK